MRGTKRVCGACEVRFYDLTRDPIVCPACGAQHKPAARQMIDVGARPASFTGKTGWRSKGFKRPEPEPDVAPEAVTAEDTTEEVPSAVPDEDVVLEQEADEGDVSGLVGHDVEAPKEP